MTIYDAFKTEVSANLSLGITHIGKAQQKAAARIMRNLATANPTAFDTLNTLAEETTYHVKRYAKNSFYCWPHHTKLTHVEPYPASRFPKALLCMEFARALAI